MSALAIVGTKTALGPNLTASFLASGGTGSYVYSVLAGGAGGSINSSSGLYTAPAQVSNDATKFYDTILVTDSATPTPATATVQIMVANYWMLTLEIIQKVMGLDPATQIWIFNQKQFQPDDASIGMWVVLMLPNEKTFASGLHPVGAPQNAQSGPGWDMVESWANFAGPMDIHIISRDLSALNRKGELVRALGSPYSRAQQVANSFYIARLPHNTVDMSGIDGADIPYHYVIAVELQRAESAVFSTDYFVSVPTPQIVVNQ